ncbi:TPA: hypothetical protein EYP44_03275, partial [Candidatus Bathyarchaeota archaeon]|nr:hypothetical protein [Candidatus Bathyarchaeota archaeon]
MTDYAPSGSADRARRRRGVACPAGLTLANLRAEARAVWECNVKEWKIELAYPISFARHLAEPLVFLFPLLLYGFALVGGRYSESLGRLVGAGDIVTYIFVGYMIMGFIGTAVWAMGFSIR